MERIGGSPLGSNGTQVDFEALFGHHRQPKQRQIDSPWIKRTGKGGGDKNMSLVGRLLLLSDRMDEWDLSERPEECALDLRCWGKTFNDRQSALPCFVSICVQHARSQDLEKNSVLLNLKCECDKGPLRCKSQRRTFSRMSERWSKLSCPDSATQGTFEETLDTEGDEGEDQMI